MAARQKRKAGAVLLPHLIHPEPYFQDRKY